MIHELNCECVSVQSHKHECAMDAPPQRRRPVGRDPGRKIRVLLNREGWDVGKCLVYRLCKEVECPIFCADG